MTVSNPLSKLFNFARIKLVSFILHHRINSTVIDQIGRKVLWHQPVNHMLVTKHRRLLFHA